MMVLLICPCSFQLCRLAPNGCPGRGAGQARGFRACRLAQSLPREFCVLFVCGILAANSRIKMLFVICPCAFRRCRLAQSVGCGLGARHFSYKLSRNMVFVTSLCAFRLRRLAQSVGCGLGIHLGRGDLVEIRAKPSLRGLASRPCRCIA